MPIRCILFEDVNFHFEFQSLNKHLCIQSKQANQSFTLQALGN